MSRGIPTVAAGLVLVAAVAVPATEPVAFKIIVNAKVTGGTIARDAVAQVYLGKARRWADGTTVVAVDLSSTSAVRQAFSEAVLAMPVDAVKNYWLRMLANGVTVADLAVPRDATLVAVVRMGHVVVPRGDTVLQIGDEVLALVTPDSEGKLKELLIGT